MIVRTRGGEVMKAELRSQPLMLDVIPPPWAVESAGGWGNTAVPEVLPAVSAAMRLIANDVSSLPVLVYRETNDDGDAEKARDTWQWELLHESPSTGLPPSQFWFDVTMGIIGRGNSYALKMRDPSSGQISALEYMGGTVQPRQDAGGWVFDWFRPWENTVVRGITADRVVHWRGGNFDGSRFGKSILELHRISFETGIAQDAHQRATYQNGALPKIAYTTTGRLSEEEADAWMEKYEARHRGPRNNAKPVLLSEGMGIAHISVTPQDAQFLDERKYNVSDIERIFLLPPGTLQELHTRPSQDADLVHRYVRQTLQPILTNIEQTLQADSDLFGPGAKLYPEFQTGAILKADIGIRYSAYLQGRQAGWLSINDIRAMENMPPIEDGDQYQTTPVGGAPNLQVKPPGLEDGGDEPAGQNFQGGQQHV